MRIAAEKTPIFDVCQIGVVLRALLIVQASAAVVCLFFHASIEQWLIHYAVLTCATLPAVLIWLVTTCAIKPILAHVVATVQWCICLNLGVFCALFAAALYSWMTATPLSRPQWLAAGMAGLLLSGVFVTLLTLREKAQQPAATVAKLAELQSRIRPHFLFNTLNSAIALIREDPNQAEHMLEDLSDLFHHALKDPNSESSLHKEIAIAKQYLNIEKIRFENRLTVHWHIHSESLHSKVPPLILQPLVENAIKHGIEPNPEGGIIDIWVQPKGQKTFVRIRNSLASRYAAQPSGNGIALENVRHRLQLMHDIDCYFIVRKTRNTFEVDFTVPLVAQPSV